MNFSLKPHPLIAHWVPGVVVVVSALLAWNDWHVSKVLSAFAGDAPKAAVSVLVLSVLAFVIGEILDSCREEKDKLNWDFFFNGDKEKVDQLDEYYFTYYVLNKNLSSAVTLAWIILIVHPPEWASWTTLFCKLLSNVQVGWLDVFARLLTLFVATGVATFAIWVLCKDAKAIRDEIEKHTKKETRS